MIYLLGDKQLNRDNLDFWVAPNAVVIGDVSLKKNASVWFGSILRGDNDPIILGENSNIQDNSVCHSDDGLPLAIGDNVTVGHKVILHSCTVGNNCLVGANALVTEGKEFPDNSLIVGSPAKVKRELTDMEKKIIELSALHYVENMKKFRDNLKEDNFE